MANYYETQYGAKAPTKPTTPGGYPKGAGDQGTTGLWRQNPVPFLPSPVTPGEMSRGRSNSKYTYRQYDVPNFAGSDQIGMPANSFVMGPGGGMWKEWAGLGNTQTELDRVSQWKAKDLKPLQVQMVKAGWLTKSAANGRPNDETINAVAFLMDQGNQLGRSWQNIVELGPDGLRQAGGADVTAAGGGPGGGGPGGGGPSTSVSSSVRYSTKAGARNYLKQALSDVLGRGPNEDEIDEFIGMLHSKEKKNPVVTTTVNDGAGTSSSTTEGGFEADSALSLAENFARDQHPEQAQRYAKAGYEQLLDSLVMGG